MTRQIASIRKTAARLTIALAAVAFAQLAVDRAAASELQPAVEPAVPGLTVHRGTDILAAKDHALRAKALGERMPSATGVLRQAATGVTVARGHGWRTSAQFEAGVAALKQPRLDVVGLDGGWFIDREAGRLINCFRERTSAIGGYRIRCASRPLP